MSHRSLLNALPAATFMFLFALSCPGDSLAQEEKWSKAGLRGGFMETSAGTFRQFEAYAVYSTRFHLELGDNWAADAQFELSGGELSHKDFNSAVFTAGPVVVLRKGTEDWFLEAGSRPTLISEDDFGRKEFGGPFQFTSHGGIGWGIGAFEIVYRFQHMSNARIYSQNDGLNLHMVEVGWRF